MNTSSQETINVQSRVNSAIALKSHLRQSLLFAELAGLSYFNEVVVGPMAQEIGFVGCRFFERDGAQAYMLWNDIDCVIACRGTEPNEWNDIRADVNAAAVVTEALGKVHKGFNAEVNDIWPLLEDALVYNTRNLWLCGHSLGGAMATICAGRCFLSELKCTPKGLFTYGSPRVGDRQFVNFVRLDYSRWVNNNDIVTRVPPAWMGYRHAGREYYLDNTGRLKHLSGWFRVRDRLRGFFLGLTQFRIDHFSDHAIDRYIENIRRELNESEGASA